LIGADYRATKTAMADRDASFFGPVLPQPADAPEAFSLDELQRIRGRRIEADLLRTASPAWPAHRRFRTLYPRTPSPRPGAVERDVSIS